jgi:uncharacterized membrane protein
MNIVGKIILAFFAISIGLYPAIYFLIDISQTGFLSSKPPAILSSTWWTFLFYQHIIFGGIALLTGWSQFIKKIRSKKINFHRTLGKVYIISCLLSGLSGLYIAFFANGGIVACLGFGGLAVSWLFSTTKAYLSIRNKKINSHENWMTRSYALTFAAVTLRLYIPTFAAFKVDFLTAYIIISWLCWVPNLLVAEGIIRTRQTNKLQPTTA